jgi:O-antigen ligase
MAVSRVLDLPVVFRSKMRWWLAAQLLVILLISMTVFKGTSWDGGTRHSGLFINPNNLALTPFILLFFINTQKDKWFVRVALHAVVVAALIFSGTSGATVAYAVGLAVHLTTLVSKKSRSIVYGLAAVGVLAGGVFIATGGERLLPDTRLTHQITVMRTQIANVIDGTNIAYYAQEKVLGSGSGSAIWRVEHWRETITTYAAATVPQQIFGLGIGSSPRMLGKLPHNEYLRLLFEQGIVGFLLFYFAWFRIVRTAPPAIRYVALIVAIYSFSENNLDNFPFMAMFALCLSARNVSNLTQTVLKQPLSARWNASVDRPQISFPGTSVAQ